MSRFSRLLSTLQLLIFVSAGFATQWEMAEYRVQRHYNQTLTATGEIDILSLANIRTALDLEGNTDLQQWDSIATAQGTTLIKMIESYNGKNVRRSGVDLSVKPDGTIDRVGGMVTKNLANSLTGQKKGCKLSKNDLFRIALEFEGIRQSWVIVQRSKVVESVSCGEYGEPLYLSSLDLFYTVKDTDISIRKIYRIDACTRRMLDVEVHKSTDSVFLGRQTGSIYRKRRSTPLKRKPNLNVVKKQLCDPFVAGIGGNERTGPVTYGEQPNCLSPFVNENGLCFLKNEFIKIVDLKNGTNENVTEVANFPCHTGYDDSVNGGFSPVLDTFYHATMTARMYKEWYNYSPLTNPAPLAFVHFGSRMDNALWDGQNIIVGDGSSLTFPFSVLDVVAHEFTHGVTEKSSGLELRKESGGINEAFSDMAGEVTEAFTHGVNDWLVGRNLFKQGDSTVRYFVDPSVDGMSIKHIQGFSEKMNIHYSSGLFNRVFYIVSQTLGIRRAFQAFLVANRIYWRETTSFEEGGCDVIKAAYDCGFDLQVFRSAFEEIGLKLNMCQDFSKFILPISVGETRENLLVSQYVQPVFKISPPENTVGISISVAGGLDIRIAVTSSASRFPKKELISSFNQIFFNFQGEELIFIRLSSDTEEERVVSMTISFY